MPIMPLPIEKGAVIAALEQYLDTEDHRITFMMELRDGKPLADCSPFAGSLTAREHVREHWRQTPGWMQRWQGDADAISRETMLRALEVATATPRDKVASDTQLREMHPIDIILTCGAEQFQGFVTWRTSLEGKRVVVVLSAPDYGPAGYAYWTGLTADGKARLPKDSTAKSVDRAVWVIGHVRGERGADGRPFVSSGLVSTATVALKDGGY
jgi:hypothetical protein